MYGAKPVVDGATPLNGRATVVHTYNLGVSRVPYPIFTEEHDALRASVRQFVAAEITPHVDKWEANGHFPDSVFRRCGELGYLGLHYPERWGGADGDLAAGLVFMEELAKCGCGAIPMAIGVQTDMATPALAQFGTDDQRDRYLAPAIAGEKIASIAITEPDAGSDVASIRTTAVRDGDAWVINGAKTYITNGSRASFLTLVTKTDPSAGHRGISLFLVDTDLPGVTISRTLDKLGMRSSDTAEFSFVDVVVPNDNLIGLAAGQGFAQLMWQLQYERLISAAGCVGQAELAIEDAVEFVQNRQTFGRPLGDHQVIAHKLAECRTELEAMRALLYVTAMRIQTGEYPVDAISITKKFGAQALNRILDTCLQVHGGAGYMTEYRVSRMWRDARLQRIGAGTDEMMDRIIAKEMGLKG